METQPYGSGSWRFRDRLSLWDPLGWGRVAQPQRLDGGQGQGWLSPAALIGSGPGLPQVTHPGRGRGQDSPAPGAEPGLTTPRGPSPLGPCGPGCLPLPLPRTLKSLPLRSTPRTKGRTPVAAMAEGRGDPGPAPRPDRPRPPGDPPPGPPQPRRARGLGGACRYFRQRVGGAGLRRAPIGWVRAEGARCVRGGGARGQRRARAGPGSGAASGAASPRSAGSGVLPSRGPRYRPSAAGAPRGFAVGPVEERVTLSAACPFLLRDAPFLSWGVPSRGCPFAGVSLPSLECLLLPGGFPLPGRRFPG